MIRILSRSGFKYLLRHPLQGVLSIVGIALGAAVVVSIDIANDSSGRAFELSMESISGKATHQIYNSSASMDDSTYINLKLNTDIPLAPVVQRYISAGDDYKRTFLLMGVDPFAERPFRTYLSGLRRKTTEILSPLMTQPNTALIAKKPADDLGVRAGDSLKIRVGGRYMKIKIIAVLKPNNERSARALQNLIITDIAAAQEIAEQNGKLTRIDVIIPDNEQKSEKINSIKAQLPEGIYFSKSASRSSVNESMTDAFNMNLTAMSLLALIVGMFLIYNTMTFSVVQRRNHIGLLRSIGVTKREIFRNIIKESLVLGIIGTIFGLLFGILLGRGMLNLVTQSINDLYFVVSVKETDVSPWSLIKGAGLGVVATVLAALKPAREATNAPARVVLYRSRLETGIRERIPRLTITGLVFIAIGVTVFFLPGNNVLLSYAGIVPLIIGCSLMSPLVISFLVKIVKPALRKISGIIGSMAAGGLISQISRTAVAVSALAIAVSAAVGVGTMVSSFRQTVVQWLETRLAADIYVSVPSMISRFNDQPFEPDIVDDIRKLPGIENMNLYREFRINTDERIIHILAADLYELRFNTFKTRSDNKQEVRDAFYKQNAVLVSEPFAYRNDLDIGDSLQIPTDRGPKKFKVAGIYYDYSSDIGLVLISYDNFKKYWDDRKLSGMAIFTKKGADNEQVMQNIRELTGKNEHFIVQSNRKLLESSVKVFDRTFIITNVLQLLAILVAFIGILSSLMALQMERTKELGVLRANGITPRQLRILVIMQTGLIGLAAGIMSLPLGNILAAVLIFIINKRSFGWTLQFDFMPELMLQAVLLAVVAAILAGIYPAYKMSKTSPSVALREE